jgi:methionyl-tRNA formyltransferase
MTRAYDPWPGAQTSWRGQPFKIIAAQAHLEWAGGAAPGTLLPEHGTAWVATGAGALELLTIQPAGKRPLAATDWWRGLRTSAGARLGG